MIRVLRSMTVLAVLAWSVPSGASDEAVLGNINGKISRNFYRIPYGNTAPVNMVNDYVTHNGAMDMRGTAVAAPFVVAGAAGMVTSMADGRNECGCNLNTFGPCPNFVTLRHANGEISQYLHMAQNSIFNLGINVGDNVVVGQALGIEGDVGFTCGSESPPRTGSCATTIPPGTGNCFRHLHWVVWREATGERVQPLTCGIDNNIYEDNGSYTAGACSSAGCPTFDTISATTLSGFGTFRVWQADDTVTASTLVTQNSASAVLHAGERVRLTPGFRARAGSYFRGEIGTCNFTAFAPPGGAGSSGLTDSP